jgi:membrane protein
MRRMHGLLKRVGELYRFVRRVSDTADSHDVDLIAAGLAFYALLGFFPALLAIVSIYGLVADPISVQHVLTSLAETLPPQARQIVTQGLSEFVKRPSGTLSLSIGLGLLAVIWSSSSAMSVLVRAIDVAYGVKQKRSFFQRRRLAILFTLGGVLGVAVVVPLITALPKVLHFLRADTLVFALPWFVLGLVAFLSLMILFRYAPHVDPPSFRSVFPGAAGATLVWLLLTGLYSIYVRYIAKFSSTYGALEGVIVLEFWFYVSALVLVYGTELNVELECRRGTRKRSSLESTD